MTYGKKEKLKILLKNMLKMNKIIFVKVTGFHNIFNVFNNTYNISELKSSVTKANKNSIIFITADSTDEDYGYMFSRLKQLDHRAILDYVNNKHFNWELFDLLVK